VPGAARKADCARLSAAVSRSGVEETDTTRGQFSCTREARHRAASRQRGPSKRLGSPRSSCSNHLPKWMAAAFPDAMRTFPEIDRAAWFALPMRDGRSS